MMLNLLPQNSKMLMLTSTHAELIIDKNKCNSSMCKFECINVCNVSRRDRDNPAIVEMNGRPVINLDCCTLCGLCKRNCPLEAIFFDTNNTVEKIERTIDLEIWESTPYIIDNEKYKQFNQENTIFARVGNDPSFDNYQTSIHSKRSKILKLNKPGFSKIEAALSSSSWTVHDKFSGAFSWGKVSSDPKIKFDANLAKLENERLEIEDKEDMSIKIKQIAKSFGATSVGICKLRKEWIYSHDRQGDPINLPDHIKNVIVLTIEMDLEALQTSPAYPAAFATGNAYSRMAFVQSCLAECIRDLGYDAIPAGNGIGLSVPMAIDAGLGQYGRHGLLITPKHGSNVRICKVFTNMPLVSDKPINFGVLDFCRNCMRCAKNCPSQSISYNREPTWSGPTVSNNLGVAKWYVNVESCYNFWIENANDCSNCIVSCPFTKNRHWSHNIVRFFIKHIPFFNRLWIKLDHWMGYGKQRDPKEFWEKNKKFIHSR